MDVLVCIFTNILSQQDTYHYNKLVLEHVYEESYQQPSKFVFPRKYNCLIFLCTNYLTISRGVFLKYIIVCVDNTILSP
jgi:hypothetical protein